MRRRLAPILLAAALLCPSVAAQAQSLGLSFGAEGRLAPGYTDRVPGADLFLFGDATARLAFDGLPLGLELGVFGLADAIDTPHETYGAVTWDIARGGRLFVGVPRPAYDSFAASALEGPFPSLGTARTGTTRSLTTFGAMFANYLPFGVRFENRTERLRYAASVHSVPNQDLAIAGLGLAWPMGDWVVEGAVEVAMGSSTGIAGKVQAHGGTGRITGGVGLFLPGTVGGSDAVEVFGAFDAHSGLTLSGVVQVPLDGSTDPTAGATLRYSINDSTAISAGVMSDAGADAAFNALVNFRF